jgi:hypothetical protein
MMPNDEESRSGLVGRTICTINQHAHDQSTPIKFRTIYVELSHLAARKTTLQIRAYNVHQFCDAVPPQACHSITVDDPLTGESGSPNS